MLNVTAYLKRCTEQLARCLLVSRAPRPQSHDSCEEFREVRQLVDELKSVAREEGQDVESWGQILWCQKK